MEWRRRWWAGAPIVSNDAGRARLLQSRLFQGGGARLTAVSFGLTLRVLRGRRGTGEWRRARLDGREAELWELLVILG